MKQVPIERLTGLSVQKNSFTVNPGSLEVADNCVLVQDNIISKCRGFRNHNTYPNGQVINSIFDYQNSTFSVSQNTLYRNIQAAVTAQAKCFSGSTDMTIRKAAHGIRNGDDISDFIITNTDSVVSSFTSRQLAFYGTRSVTTLFTGTVSRTSNVVTITLNRHGMNSGDTITVGTNSISIAESTFAITSTGTNTFTIASSGSNGSGTASFTTVDSFRISATENAIATATSSAAAASYRYYKVTTGTTIAVSTIKNSRSASPNKSAYFTSDNGIIKLEREDLPCLKAGIPPGLDLQADFVDVDGVITPNCQLAYRIVFGRRDANHALVLGSPSSAITLTNRLIDVDTAEISYNDMDNIVTVDLGSVEHGLVTNDLIYLYSFLADPASYVIADATTVPITRTDDNVFTFDLDDISVDPTAVTSITSFSYGVAKNVDLTFSIPSELTSTEYIYQIYRTSLSVNQSAAPEQNYRLVTEDNITAAQITNGFVDFTDEIDPILIASNPELYTNPTQEGEFQSNFRPPLALDIEVFKNYMFLGNITDFRTMGLSLVAPNDLANDDYVTIGTSAYVFRGNSTNDAVGNDRVTSAATTSSYVEVTQVKHGFSSGDVINVLSYNGVTGIALGQHSISSVPSADTFRFGSGAAGSGAVEYEGLSNAAGKRLVTLTIVIAGGETLSEAIELTAQSFVKAINRNTAGDLYSQYVSGLQDSPGKMFFIAKNLSLATFAATANSSGAGLAFVPVLPTTGTAVSDDVNVKPNALRISKLSEYEAFPLVNEILIGSASANILRVKALRDSLIVIKQDGVFRVNGDSVSNFTATILDNTVKCVAPNSAATLNNSVYCLSNQGIVQITDSSARIVSRETVEPLFSSIIGISNIADLTFGVGYESERLYLLSTVKPNSDNTVANQVYVYNYLTDQFTNFTEDKVIFSCAHLSKIDDKILYVPASNPKEITKERKQQNRIDFTGQEYISNVLKSVIASVSAATGVTTLTITFNLEHDYAIGDLITVSHASTAIASAFTGGAADINGLRTVASVVDEFIITVDADSAANFSTIGNLYVQYSISELDVVAATTSASSTVLITTEIAHGLTTGSSVMINSISSGVLAVFSLASDLTGRRTITVLSATTFIVNADSSASGSVTGSVNLSDKKQTPNFVTMNVASTVIPQKYDAIVSNDKIYTIIGVTRFSATQYITELRGIYKSISTDIAYLNSGIKSTMKFAPIHGGSINTLKSFAEFQAAFRNSSSCTALTNYFTSDGFVSSRKNEWNYRVGTSKTNIEFLSWGKGAWGKFPWGGGISILRNFFTGPAVIYRTSIPAECFYATFIQPVIEHRVAGESIELQNISLYVQPQTSRVSR